jgi:hypothetical protein
MPSEIIKDPEKIKLEAYSKAQTNTIIELSRKLKESQDKVSHLEKLLEGSVPLIKTESTVIDKANDQEYICRTEIHKLKKISEDRELTLEECKRLDIYSKILKDLGSGPKQIDEPAKKMTDEELLAIAEAGKSTKQ